MNYWTRWSTSWNLQIHLKAVPPPQDYLFLRVQNEFDLEKWFATRRDIYLESKFISKSDLNEEGHFVDEYDAYSDHILAMKNGGGIVGCIRLICSMDSESPLQIQRHFNVEVEPRAGEISGFAVKDEFRATEVTLGLIRAVCELARARNVEAIYTEVEKWFLASLKKSGFPLVAITEVSWLYNTWNLVAKGSITEFFEKLEVASDKEIFPPSAMANFFSQPYSFEMGSFDKHEIFKNG